VSYSTGFADLFLSIEPYVWGRDTRDGIAYNLGATWYFVLLQAKAIERLVSAG
jgi:hypothetical protein